MGSYWTDPPLSDRFWYPLWEKMVHVSASANRNFYAIGAHSINGHTIAFMQFVTSDLFKDFPTQRLIIPNGGDAVLYHEGRYRGLAQDSERAPLSELMSNVYFDACLFDKLDAF